MTRSLCGAFAVLLASYGMASALTPTPNPTVTPSPTVPTPTRTPTRTPTSILTATRTPTATPPLSLSINDVQGSEGVKLGFFSFPVSLNTTSTHQVTVGYSTVDGTAKEGLDYRPASGTLTFLPGDTSKTIQVSIIDDTIAEPTESFFVDLLNPVGAVIARGQGTGTILDNDGSVGTAELAPASSSVQAGETTSLTLTWTDPVNWHDLNTVDFRLEGDHGPVLWVRFDEAQNTFALCESDGTCGAGAQPGSANVFRSGSATLFLMESRVKGSGPTGPSVDLTYAFSLGSGVAGQTLQVEAAATNDAGTSQDFGQVGTLTVTSAFREGGGGCSLAAAQEPMHAGVWLLLVPLALWRRGGAAR